MRTTELWRYPVKSMRGEPLDTTVVEPWGLAGDRRWMVVDRDGVFVTARECPRLLLVRPELVPGGVHLSAPGAGWTSAEHPITRRDVRVHRSVVPAAWCDDDANDWLSDHLGRAVFLVHLDDPTARRTNRGLDTDRVSFADAYPLLLTTESSLTQVNDWIAEGPLADEGPLPMRRFRPNVVVDGQAAFAEDGWRRVRVGDVEFRVSKSCDRCVMTTKDPDTAAGGKEPIATLARHRKWDGEVWFGINLIPDGPGSIAVGDELEVLDGVASTEPLR